MLLIVVYFHTLQKRREQKVESSGLDDGDNELLQQNKVERDEMMKEIRELRERSVSIHVCYLLPVLLQRWRALELAVTCSIEHTHSASGPKRSTANWYLVLTRSRGLWVRHRHHCIRFSAETNSCLVVAVIGEGGRGGKA